MFKQVASTDFLMCRPGKRSSWTLREIPALYVVGQIQPKTQVKTPNARDANAAIKEMLSVFICRLFRQSPRLNTIFSALVKINHLILIYVADLNNLFSDC
jgi:hypothetical protein